ncbi:hypothetical protein ACFFF7_04530 [Novosphingobium aquiterrae]|uniref:Uncharacterized protein n=1 Tax=Novosphingobium aquiterrae TaxID=624388 RepID=A0ABV6PFT5_9SPHN
MSTQIFAALAAVSLIGAGVAGAAETRAIDAIPGASALMGAGQGGGSDKCRVDVIRSGAAGTADVTRQVLDNGGCVCIVTTGAAASNGSAEDIVRALLRDRTCDGAPLAAAAAGSNPGVGGPVSAAATSGGGSGAILPVLIGGVGAAGLAVALGKSSKG